MSPQTEVIPIRQLRAVCERIFDAIEAAGMDEVGLTEDYYWLLDEDDLFKLEATPQVRLVGQLTEDWSELKESLERDHLALPWHELDHLAPVIRYLGWKLTR